MKRCLLLYIMLLFPLFFMGCASTRNSTVSNDLAYEAWMGAVEINPNMWARGADAWFLTGDPNSTEQANHLVPLISTTQVAAPNFSNIKVDGAFQVQIYGSPDSKVAIYGPNDAVRGVIIDFRGDTLYLHQDPKAPLSHMKSVIVRIGVRNLSKLIQMGCGSIEAIQIQSCDLRIITAPGATGSIYLSGNVNLTCITQRGNGCINVFGANTPQLDIDTSGNGAINICGNVGVRCITHSGQGDINIIGANTNGLIVSTKGSGKIVIKGIVNIREIRARGHTCVFICTSSSNSICAFLFDSAQVGVAGLVENLTVNAYNNARFYGRNLCARNAFVRVKDGAHINVAASDEIFASATQNGSIYFFGAPNSMSQFVNGNGVVIPIWYGARQGICTMMPQPIVRVPVYKGEVAVYQREVITSTRPVRYKRSKWPNKRLQMR